MIFRALELAGGVLENETPNSTAPKSLLPLQINRHGAIADRISNVKFTPG
jgi:hypothetical protein